MGDITSCIDACVSAYKQACNGVLVARHTDSVTGTCLINCVLDDVLGALIGVKKGEELGRALAIKIDCKPSKIHTMTLPVKEPVHKIKKPDLSTAEEFAILAISLAVAILTLGTGTQILRPSPSGIGGFSMDNHFAEPDIL